MKRYFVFLLYGLLLFPAVVFAGVESDTLSLGKPLLYKKYGSSTHFIGQSAQSSAVGAKPKKTWFKAMRYSGYARLYMLHRQMQEYYNIAPTQGLSLPTNLTVGDGYQQPLMLFRLEGNPTAKTYFQMELQFDHRLLTTYTTPIVTDTLGRAASLYVIFQLQGAVETKIGKFKLTAGGGANWFRLSPSTLWGYQYRDDLFERYPWEPEGHDFSRYMSSYSVGDIPRDQRFGKQATQGFILEGTDLPGGFNAAVLYGKTQSTGGYQSYLVRSPQNMFAARVERKFGDHKLGVNYFNQFGYTTNKVVYKPIVKNGTDTFYVEDNRLSTIVTSFDGRFDFKNISIFTELGAGSYVSSKYNAGLKDNAKTGVDHISRYKRDWSEMLFLEITTKKELTYLPLKLAVYRIGRNVVNNSSSIANTSVEEAKPTPDVPDRFYTNYFDGMVTDIGQLANNRQGVNLFANKDFGKLKAKLGLGIAQEIINLVGDLRNGARAVAVANGNPDSLTKVPFTNSISFEHRLNGVTRSRFGFYERFTGPYGRTHSIFRRTYDNIVITDTEVNYKKSFSTAEVDLKYKLKLLGKELLLTNFINYSSVQDEWSPIPLFTDQAFLRYFYEEFMAFYAVHPKLTLVGFWGMERVLGNKRTEVADANGKRITDTNGRPIASDNGKPIDQTGYGYGLGLDYNFHGSASLNLRQRWFTHADKNFTLDRFSGNEMTIEFKVFF